MLVKELIIQKTKINGNNKVKRIYINTLVPNFKFKNHKNETVFNKNPCVKL